MTCRFRNLGVAAIAAMIVFGSAGAALLCENALRLPSQIRKVKVIAGAAEVAVDSEDGYQLKASQLKTAWPSRGTVVLFHGVADSRAGVVGQAFLLNRNGFRVIAPDSRGHGRSGGDLFTFGVLEVDDVRRWVKWVEARHPGEPVFALGESMGAGVPFQLVVAESPFRTFRDVAEYRLGQKLPTLGPLFVPPAFWYARWRYGVDLDTASPADAVRRTKVPTLIIHGTADTNIPPAHGQDLAAAGGACVQFWGVPGGGHTDAISRAPAEFERRVLAWFSAASPPPGCPRS